MYALPRMGMRESPIEATARNWNHSPYPETPNFLGKIA